MQRWCWPLAGLFAVLSLVLVYAFVVRGATVPASDGRTAILLNAGERDLVLAEMRGFLVAVQGISEGIVQGDSAAIIGAARAVGAAAQQGVPASLVRKLPLEFKQLGFDTHSKFDQLALNTEQLGDTSAVLAEVSTLLQNCVACHASYRIDLEQP